MKMLRKPSKMVLIPLLLVLFNVNSYADCVTDCKTALNAADKVIADLHKEVDLHKSFEAEQNNQIAQLNVSINEKNQALGAWYHNPFITGLIGIVVGGTLVLFAKK